MTIFDNLTSSAVTCVKIDQNLVFITYKKSKEYMYLCDNISVFEQSLKQCIGNKESIGKFLHMHKKNNTLKVYDFKNE